MQYYNCRLDKNPSLCKNDIFFIKKLDKNEYRSYNDYRTKKISESSGNCKSEIPSLTLRLTKIIIV